jgi:hypothetical protein
MLRNHFSLSTLRKFLLGCKINIFTEHGNLRYLSSSNLQRVQQWKLLIDELAPTINFISGNQNTLADFLSREAIIQTTTLTTDQLDHQSVIEWFHLKLQHPGLTRQYNTMRPLYKCSGLYKTLPTTSTTVQHAQNSNPAQNNMDNSTVTLTHPIP